MLAVYCIPGLGINEEVFGNLKLTNCTLHYIKWITPLKNEKLPEYALRLAEQIDTTQPFALIGMSFGGMCAIEIAKKFKSIKTILISSNKTSAEVPLNISMWAPFPFYKSMNDAFYRGGAIRTKSLFGVKTREQSVLFERMLNAAPENYFAGAIHCIISWTNKEVPENVVHIHGTADLILPYHKIVKCDYPIKDGTHFMIEDRADELSAIINEELKRSVVSFAVKPSMN
jgi:pimeloyl-ACP methyl ester carboxylesterase